MPPGPVPMNDARCRNHGEGHAQPGNQGGKEAGPRPVSKRRHFLSQPAKRPAQQPHGQDDQAEWAGGQDDETHDMPIQRQTHAPRFRPAILPHSLRRSCRFAPAIWRAAWRRTREASGRPPCHLPDLFSYSSEVCAVRVVRGHSRRRNLLARLGAGGVSSRYR